MTKYQAVPGAQVLGSIVGTVDAGKMIPVPAYMNRR